jgi:CheY-like chemotaxis protein
MKMKKSRVLVVDDNQPVRELISCMLISRGLQIIQADGGEKGIDILPDIRTPNIDGFSVFDYLQQDSQTAKIPFEKFMSFLLAYLTNPHP